jgi:hypothetical protein
MKKVVTKKLTLPQLNIDFFVKHNACYPPEKALGVGWKGNILDVLKREGIPAKDKIWAFSREGVVPDWMQRLAAVYLVRKTPVNRGCVVDLLTDRRSLDALVIAEEYALGNATEDDLTTARTRAAVWAKTETAAAAAAAARSAAAATAWNAAESAAADAAETAARSATADRATVWAKAKAAQVDIIIDLIKEYQDKKI